MWQAGEHVFCSPQRRTVASDGWNSVPQLVQVDMARRRVNCSLLHGLHTGFGREVEKFTRTRFSH
jgi:hypothetical protein